MPAFLSVILLGQCQLGGYVEARPYLFIAESLQCEGDTRGWIELANSSADHGVQVALGMRAPFDTLLALDQPEIAVTRLALWLGPDHARIICGRQRLYWGVGRVFRPLGVLDPTNYLEPDYERAGCDVLYARVAIGALSDLRGVLLPRREVARCLAGLRLGTNAAGNDLGVTGFYCDAPHQAVAGVEIAGEYGAGYWFEGGWTDSDHTDHARLTAGLDYTLPVGLYVMGEYYFDGSGASRPEEYDYAALTEGERQTLAQNYLYGSLSVVHNPCFRPALNLLLNIDDCGVLFMPRIDRGISANVDVTLGAIIPVGRERTEFQRIYGAEVLFLWIKAYF